ncbi:CTP pyrophosphohydrolase [Anaerotignum neopropionicum]|uniref:8-oxo-dGTP diphosphatase n=1 Tax=Anaerotignum neopropionicum TaxID=36847 RepID=A0A136WDY0_9FIRM|nr:(deoxy)nucleoside triphosphate pyrophosphohydrolase [Anaerotignum neopropionicum]KXL52728.1 CTP pyrophosphohydrolase [Anaerotignum neopropionicum]
MTEVVAALLCQDDRFLICQRPAHKKRGLLWEFVGGKREAGESKEKALVRECREELGITVKVGEVFMELTHSYPDITIELTLFWATIFQGTPQLLEHEDFLWIKVEDIPKYAFCPADEEVLRRLMERGLPRENQPV